MPAEVSVRALELPFRYLRRRHVPIEPLLQGLKVPPASFFRKSARIDWDDFVVVCRRISDAVGGHPNLPAIGHTLLSAEVWRPLKFILRAVTNLDSIYGWVASTGQRSMFANLRMSSERRPTGIMFRISHDPRYQVCEEYHLITKGVLEATPALLGYPFAVAQMARAGSETTYELSLPARRTWHDRLSGLVQLLRFNRLAAARELQRSYDLLEQEHHELEAAKRAVDELNLSLEKRVEERTRELSQARDQLAATVAELEAAMVARDRLFANLNHEFRTPLSLILLPLQRLQREDALRPHHPRLRVMESNARRLLKLVDDLLEIAASREGRLELELRSVDVASLVRDTLEAYGPAAERLGLALRADVPDSAVVVGDPEALARILDNLLGNAIKYTPRGGSVAVSIAVAAGTLRLAVRDSGVGISLEDQERIFERFARASTPLAAGASSSGIGLALVRELVRAHGGGVGVRSAPGEGATFEVTLPCAPTEELLSHRRLGPVRGAPLQGETPLTLAAGSEGLEGPSGAVAAPAGGDGPLVLVAEDNPELRAQIAELLAPAYRLVLAEDGAQALEVFDRQQVDAVVCDLLMPGMDGLDLLRQLRSRPGGDLVPFLLVTAVHDREALARALESGADDFLVKPFHEAELLGRVRAQLRLRALAGKLARAQREATAGLLLSSLAHELRNPLNVLVNGLAPLRESVAAAGPLDPETAGLLAALEDAGRRVSGLSDQLLGFPRAAADDGAHVNVPELIDQSLKRLHPRLDGIPLSKHIGYAGAVRGSAPVLSQVVVNLVENALHATRGQGPVGIEARAESDRVVLDVWDAGPGVPAEHRDRIFDPFFSTKAPGEGTGLGLALSRAIAERHGGQLALAPSDHGARFRLTLPRASS